MNRLMLAATAVIVLSSASAANATVTIGSSLAFSPAVTLDFEQAVEGASLNSYYAGQGVTFASVWQSYAYAGTFPPELSGGGAINFTPAFNTGAASDFTINFSSVQTDAGFSVVTDAAGTFSTYLGGFLVESASYSGGYQPGADVISFTNSSFDSIRFAGTGDHAALIDNLGFSVNGVVPEPATWAMMLVGLGGLGAAMRSRRTRFAAA